MQLSLPHPRQLLISSFLEGFPTSNVNITSSWPDPWMVWGEKLHLGSVLLAGNWGAGPTCHPQACTTTGSPGSAGSAVERTLLRALQCAQGTAVIPSLRVLQRAVPIWGSFVWLVSSLVLVEVPMSVGQSVRGCWIRWGCVCGSSWAIPMCTLSVFGLCGACNPFRAYSASCRMSW